MSSENERGYKLISIGTAIVAAGVGGQLGIAVISEGFSQTEPIGPLPVVLAGGLGVVLGLLVWFLLAQLLRRSAKG